MTLPDTEHKPKEKLTESACLQNRMQSSFSSMNLATAEIPETATVQRQVDANGYQHVQEDDDDVSNSEAVHGRALLLPAGSGDAVCDGTANTGVIHVKDVDILVDEDNRPALHNDNLSDNVHVLVPQGSGSFQDEIFQDKVLTDDEAPKKSKRRRKIYQRGTARAGGQPQDKARSPR